jgi:Leucine-rich repeat (LRR) protein
MGWTNQIPARPQQSVSSVNFAGPLTNLQYWASSHNPLTALDFTGFTALQSIDCYQCGALARVVVTNLPSLRRICVESCHLAELDVSGDTNLEELRAAGNLYTNIGVGGGVGPKVWHWCTRDNPLSQQFADVMTNFYSLRDFYAWNNNQAGLLALVSTNLAQVAAYSNRYACADFSGHSNLWLCEVFANNLTNLVLNGCTGLRRLDASRNRLPASVLDAILGQLDTNAPTLGFVDLSQNAQRPTSVGYTHYSNLKKRGVTVYVDGR